MARLAELTDAWTKLQTTFQVPVRRERFCAAHPKRHIIFGVGCRVLTARFLCSAQQCVDLEKVVSAVDSTDAELREMASMELEDLRNSLPTLGTEVLQCLIERDVAVALVFFFVFFFSSFPFIRCFATSRPVG